MKAVMAKLTDETGSLKAPWTAAWDVYFDWWYKRAKSRAWQDTTWAEIERRRHDGDRRTTIMFSDRHDLTMEHWEKQGEIFDRLNPRPWVFRAQWWLQAHGPAAQRANLTRSWQRARHGWAVSDTWDLHTYLSKVIAGSVEHLRTHTHGHPCPITAEEWDDILRRVVAGFEPTANSEGDVDETDEITAKREEALHLLSQWFRHLWD